MQINPIITKADHRAALKEIESLMTAKSGTSQGERLDVLVTLVEAHERKHYPLDLPDPIEAIKFRMEQMNLTPKDLSPTIGQADLLTLRFFSFAKGALYLSRWPSLIK